MSDQPPALNNVNEAIKDVNNNNNDDDKQPSRNSSTSSTETASISSEVSSDSIDSTEEDKKKKEDENYKRKLDGLIKKRMADITTPVDDEESQQQTEVMRKKLEEERVKILQEINERKKSSESKEDLNAETTDDASLDTPGQLRRRNSPRMSPKIMTRDDEKSKGISIKEVNSSELEEVSLADPPAGVAPSTPSTPKLLTKSQSKGKTDSPRVPMKTAKVVSKSSSFVQEVRDALTKKIDTKAAKVEPEPKSAAKVSAAMLSRTQSKLKLKEMSKTNLKRSATTTDEIDPKAELRAKAKLASIEASMKTKTETEPTKTVEGKTETKTTEKPKFDLKNIPQVNAHLAIKINSPLKGNIDDHPINHGKRGTYRVFLVLVVLCTIMYEITALPQTFLPNNPVWWFILWTTTLYMNLAFLLFLSNFWWRATMKCEQYPEDARPNSTSPYNRFVGSVSVSLFPIAGEGVEMVKKHFGALYDSHVTGLHRDIMVICDDLRLPTMQDDKEIPCLSSLEPTQGFSEPYLFRAKDTDPKYLEMANQIAQDKGLTHKEDQSLTNEDGTGYVCWKYWNPQNEQKCFYYFARHKWDNVASMLKGANLNQAMELPEVRHELKNAPSGHSFVFIVDARHQIKAEFKAALLQYFWTWNPDAKQFMYHDKLASVQAQHWYPNIPNGHPLQPNNRFFFDGVMKGRAGRGSTPNAGTMNVFNYQALLGIDPEYPDESRFCIYSVTEDKATEIEYFCRGYYAIYHPYVVSSGVPANTLAKEFDRLLRWARGNFVILSKRNCVFHSHGMKPLFRLWAIEGTIYPINGLITLLFYFACIIYVAFGVTFLTFHSVTVLVMFLGLMIVGRVSYLLSVPTMTQEDMWANMQAWLNTMPVYVWAVFTYYKGFAKNAVWLSTGSKATTDGTKIQWIVVCMQFINIVSIFLGVGFLFGKGYTDMWEFFARMGLGIMLIVMQWNCVIDILVQNGVLKKDARLGPVVIFTLFIVVGLIFCLMWQFQVAPPTN